MGWGWLTAWGSWQRRGWRNESWVASWRMSKKFLAEQTLRACTQEMARPMLSASEYAEEICQLLVPISGQTLPIYSFPLSPHAALVVCTIHLLLCGKGTHFGSSGSRALTWKQRNRKKHMWAHFSWMCAVRKKSLSVPRCWPAHVVICMWWLFKQEFGLPWPVWKISS